MNNDEHYDFIDYMEELEKEKLRLNRIKADRDNETFKLEGKELNYSELDFGSELWNNVKASANQTNFN